MMCTIMQQWMDKRLSWNASEADATSIYVKSKEVWVPDVAMINK